MSTEDDEEVRTCQKRVASVMCKSPLARLLLLALKQSGCSVLPHRHLACESCSAQVDGGYDAAYNQLIVCSNRCRSETKVEEILTHELVHMYDYCTAKVDFKDMDHLACTEIR
jgi:inner membrane protease ATP23